MSKLEEVASGLRFPEGPVAMPDGSVLVVEMFGPRITRVRPDGSKETVADVPGGPNGLALGPDGAAYLCNNGGCFTEVRLGDQTLPGPHDPDRYIGGRIQRVDLDSGDVTDLYTECDGWPLRAPNDLVFDEHGGFYFTDHGVTDTRARVAHLTGLYYAQPDGSAIREVVFPASSPNGIGLSPDGTTLYWAETMNGRVMRRQVTGPGVVAPATMGPADCLYGLGGLQLLDSLAVDGDGNVCVATLVNGGITVVSPAGELVEFVATDDLITTNICFGGPDLTTAYITASSTGRVLRTAWPRPGARLHHAVPAAR
ncbi:MAG TPA: SMP-30/gluconolactonase/LRE family protein [Acidimicrobiales bacterium]|jgi:gluconolactonase|nr:SMP-30/gluconolactonase/LRE family protein [Acidimicrobiales bacterium]